MPLAKPYPNPDLIIPLDDDDFEEEEIEVHSLQQQVKQLSRLTEESAARLAYVIGDNVHDYRRTYYNLSMLPPEEQCALDSLRDWAEAVDSESRIHAGLVRRLHDAKGMLRAVKDFSPIYEDIRKRIHGEYLTVLIGNVRRLERGDIHVIFAPCGSMETIRIDRNKCVAEVKFRTQVGFQRALKLHHTRPFGNRISVKPKHAPLQRNPVDLLDFSSSKFQFTFQVTDGNVTGWSCTPMLFNHP